MGRTIFFATAEESTSASTSTSKTITATGWSTCTTSVQAEYWVSDRRSTVPSVRRSA